VNTSWSPELIPDDPALMRIGVDSATGETVTIPVNSRLLVTGAIGTGKTWMLRPLMATALMRGYLIYMDPKGYEASLWESVCQTAVTGDDFMAVVEDLWNEMNDRRQEMKDSGAATWSGAQITTVVNEGVEVLSTLKQRDLQRLLYLTVYGKSFGMPIWWSTANPRIGGPHPGLPPGMAVNMDRQFSLMGPNPGHGYLADRSPDMIRVDSMDDATVRDLKKQI
jgi:hypothetical protein